MSKLAANDYCIANAIRFWIGDANWSPEQKRHSLRWNDNEQIWIEQHVKVNWFKMGEKIWHPDQKEIMYYDVVIVARRL